MYTWLQFKDGTLALLDDDKKLTLYDRDEDGSQIGWRDYDAEKKLRFCGFKVPVWLIPVRYEQRKKVGRCPMPRTTGLHWNSSHHLCHVGQVCIRGALRPGEELEGNYQRRKQTIGYLFEETEGLPQGCVRHAIINTEGHETFCQCFDEEGLLYRQFTERHERGCFVSARRAERLPDGSYRVFACDEQGLPLSADELPQDVMDTWPVGYSWRSPEEAEPLPTA